jgi:hypothetical protein
MKPFFRVIVSAHRDEEPAVLHAPDHVGLHVGPDEARSMIAQLVAGLVRAKAGPVVVPAIPLRGVDVDALVAGSDVAVTYAGFSVALVPKKE